MMKIIRYPAVQLLLAVLLVVAVMTTTAQYSNGQNEDWLQPIVNHQRQLADAPDPTCSTGVPKKNGDRNVCCASSCGRCGGSGCSGLPGGENACCAGAVLAAGRSCLLFPPPCEILEDTSPSADEEDDYSQDNESNPDGDGIDPMDPVDPFCATGLRLITSGVCCPASCGRCGGKGCSQLPGGQDCCIGHIAKSSRGLRAHSSTLQNGQ